METSTQLKKSIIFNLKTTIDIFNNFIRFNNFYKTPFNHQLKVKSSFTPIQKYNNVRIETVKPNSILEAIRFYNVAFYKKFKVNVISFFRLKKKKIY